MRVKLCDKYIVEREDLCKKLIDIIKLDTGNLWFPVSPLYFYFNIYIFISIYGIILLFYLII